tara:strand:- start:311 stop:520 length:210 start_codon:yes stop_codon:yes gene_type:complete
MKYLLGRFKANNLGINRDVTLKIMDVGLIRLTIADGDGNAIIHQNFKDQKIAVKTYENLLDMLDGQRIN